MIRNRERALDIILALPDETREAIAWVIESAKVLQIDSGTNESGSDIFEDDVQATLDQLALEIRNPRFNVHDHGPVEPM